MNKQLIIFLFFLCISSEMLFSAESEEPPLKRSKMEVGQNLRRSSRIAAKRPRECDIKELAKGTKKRQRIAYLRLLSQEEKDTQLVQAVQKGSLHNIKSLLEANASPDLRDEKGWPLLLMVARDWYVRDCQGQDDYDKSVHLDFINKYPQITKLLLEGKADLNVQGKNQGTPLLFAASDNYGCYFYNDSHYDQQLHSASLDSNYQILAILLQNSADPELSAENGCVPLQVVGWDSYVTLFNVSPYYNKEFHLKYLEMKLLWMKELLNYANPNAKNRKTDEAALHIVSKNRYEDLFRGQQNLDQEFYLKYLNKNVQLAKVLLDAKADPNIQNADNNRPLHISSLGNNFSIVNLLLEHGADRTGRNIDGFMPQHLAANNSSEESLGLFLQHGADLSERTMEGFTVSSLANPSLRDRLRAIKTSGTEKNKLFLACMFGPNIKSVFELIEKKKKSDFLFESLKKNNRSDCVDELIKKRVSAFINQTDAGGWTPLMWVAFQTKNSGPRIRRSSLNVMDLLLKARADTSVEANDGTTVLELGNDEAKNKIRNHNLAQGRQEVFKVLGAELPGETALPKMVLEFTGIFEPIQ